MLALSAALTQVPCSAQFSSASSATLQLDHAQLANAWLEKRGLAELAQGQVASADPLAGLGPCFARLQLGGVELLCLPEDLADEKLLLGLRSGMDAVLQVQQRWWSWLHRAHAGSPGHLKSMQRESKVLSTWLASWPAKDLAKLPGKKNSDLLEVLDKEAKGKPAQGSRTLAQLLRSEPGAAPASAQVPPVRLIVLSSREDFVGLTCAVGLLVPHQRSVLWDKDLCSWTYFDWNGTRVAALAYFEPGAKSHTIGTAMNERNPAALAHHVAQLCARSLIEQAMGRDFDPMLGGALSSAIVIEEFGTLDTRTDGDLRSRATLAREMFIPGGRSEGGLLPPILADGRWRTRQAAGFFVTELRQSQAAGAKLGDDKLRCFELRDDGEKSHVVRAPFMGREATAQVGLSPAFQLDYAELLRAYRCAFVHWLSQAAAGKESPQRFASLLAALAREKPAATKEPEGEAWDDDGTGALEAASPMQQGRGFLALVEETYGAPLSSAQAGEECLEGRFLIWLSKQK